MKDYQREFVEFLIESGALSFGTLTLKSGRVSPYFFNSARFDSAARLERLGYFYACAIAELEPQATVVFGPAYKGIPLAVAASLALRGHFGIETFYCFDRKEAKTHGDKGAFVGRVPTVEDRIVMVDDVITDGATKLEAIQSLRAISEAPIIGLVIALNRREKAADGSDPIARLEQSAGLPVRSIATLDEVLRGLHEAGMENEAGLDEGMKRRVEEYRERYGISDQPD